MQSKLSQLADPRVKNSKETIAKALTGHWRADHLFALSQHWQMYQHYGQQIAACDEQINQLLQTRVATTGQVELVYETQKKTSIQSSLQKRPLL